MCFTVGDNIQKSTQECSKQDKTAARLFMVAESLPDICNPIEGAKLLKQKKIIFLHI
jgi:hypothetical protein